MTINKLTKGFAKVNGGNIYYELAGEGEAILFLHGLFLDSRLWERQFNELSQSYKVIRLDLRGFGCTEITEEPFSNYDDIKALLDELEVEKVHVVGLSLGALMGVEFALVYPERVGSLTLCSLNLSREVSEEMQKARQEIWQALESGDIHKSTQLSEKAWLLGSANSSVVTEENRELYRNMLEHNLNMPKINRKPIFLTNTAEKLEEITAPTLIMYGALDFADYEKAASIIQERIPNSKKLRFEQSAHIMNLSEPELFTKKLHEFISSCKV